MCTCNGKSDRFIHSPQVRLCIIFHFKFKNVFKCTLSWCKCYTLYYKTLFETVPFGRIKTIRISLAWFGCRVDRAHHIPGSVNGVVNENRRHFIVRTVFWFQLVVSEIFRSAAVIPFTWGDAPTSGVK
jgi:hypothetical protein